MKILLIILASVFLINAIGVKNDYINKVNEFDTSTFGKATGHFMGTFVSCCTEGICWWYLIKNIIELW